MVSRFLCAATLILGSLVAIAPQATADTAKIPFARSLAGGCFFGQIQGGTAVGNPVTKIVTGTGGAVPLTCTAGGTLSVADPVENPANPQNAETKSATVTNATLGTIRSLGGGGPTSVTVPASATSYPLSVSMIANYDRAAQLKPGSYVFTVLLTATP